jgi:hypothetical protein
MKKSIKPRHVKRTVLVVGEGDAEVAFLRHLRGLYARDSGVAFTIKNAFGKGALHVVDVAIAQSRNAEYDLRVVLLDTDTDWSDATASRARKAKVQVFKSEPCFEAVLLAILGQYPSCQNAKAWKVALKSHAGRDAHDSRLYEKLFSSEVLQVRQAQVAVLADLIRLFSTGKV